MNDLFVKNFKDFNNTDKRELLEQVKNALENDCEIDEGIMSSIVGAVAGAAVGTKLGDAICKALGITTGPLYSMMHSRAFISVVCGYMGWKM